MVGGPRRRSRRPPLAARGLCAALKPVPWPANAAAAAAGNAAIRGAARAGGQNSDQIVTCGLTSLRPGQQTRTGQGVAIGAPSGVHPAAPGPRVDRRNGYQRPSRPRRSCRSPSVTRLCRTVACSPSSCRPTAIETLGASQLSSSTNSPSLPPSRHARAWFKRSRTGTPVEAASSIISPCPLVGVSIAAARRARSATSGSSRPVLRSP